MIRTGIFIGAAFWLQLSSAWASPGHDAVGELGALNGVALACRYSQEVSRMKEAVVANAPKERSYGMAFDESTNAAFLAFVEKRQPCPAITGFSSQVDAAIEAMETAFGKP